MRRPYITTRRGCLGTRAARCESRVEYVTHAVASDLCEPALASSLTLRGRYAPRPHRLPDRPLPPPTTLRLHVMRFPLWAVRAPTDVIRASPCGPSRIQVSRRCGMSLVVASNAPAAAQPVQLAAPAPHLPGKSTHCHSSHPPQSPALRCAPPGPLHRPPLEFICAVHFATTKRHQTARRRRSSPHYVFDQPPATTLNAPTASLPITLCIHTHTYNPYCVIARRNSLPLRRCLHPGMAPPYSLRPRKSRNPVPPHHSDGELEQVPPSPPRNKRRKRVSRNTPTSHPPNTELRPGDAPVGESSDKPLQNVVAIKHNSNATEPADNDVDESEENAQHVDDKTGSASDSAREPDADIDYVPHFDEDADEEPAVTRSPRASTASASPSPSPPPSPRRERKGVRTKAKSKPKPTAAATDDATTARLFATLDARGVGRVTARDVQRVADDHGLFYTEDEIADMLRFWDSGKRALDIVAFRVVATQASTVATRRTRRR